MWPLKRKAKPSSIVMGTVHGSDLILNLSFPNLSVETASFHFDGAPVGISHEGDVKSDINDMRYRGCKLAARQVGRDTLAILICPGAPGLEEYLQVYPSGMPIVTATGQAAGRKGRSAERQSFRWPVFSNLQ